ncbi:uncharacterized protein PRCAT00001799001 [Priceomyces carsonii]|uniref:uncharacterized protein n=1 Tax=Priceomyces carsonii TaxID=28549 RepID=UPI002EDAF543|nr:unnamed protein product [Priceomyces carsonii]
MGWFGGSSPSKVTTVSEYKEEPKKQQFLEDLPPKFEDTGSSIERSPTYMDALYQLQLSDFTIEKFTTMPCFREAMMTGFEAMGVLGVVTFLIHKNPSRAMNWGICGFFLGNVVGWEQCRSIRRKSFQTVEQARKKNQDKIMKQRTKDGSDGTQQDR